MLNKELTTVCI